MTANDIKCLKVAITTDEGDGEVTRTLTGEDAAKWFQMQSGLALFAHAHGCNPDWASLKWEESQ